MMLFMLLMTLTAWAASKTVTYTFTANYEKSNVSRWTLTFTPSGDGFGYSTGPKEVTIQNTSETTGFTVNLDDGLRLTYSQNKGHLTFWGFEGFYLNGTNDGGNSQLTLTSSHYYVTHVKMATTSGSALTGTASPWTGSNEAMDVDVDMTTQYDGPQNYRSFSATFDGTQVFGQLTVTYGDTPRSYSISYTNAVNGQNGVTNTNATSYNVATNDFQITAPTRTGYTFSGFTYTDAEHPNATAVNLSQSPLVIHRGEAATRKAITFEAAWTAHTYTLCLHHNDGTNDYTDQTLTYDQVANIQSVTRTGYHITGWSTTQNGSVEYTEGQSVRNLTAAEGAVIDLYAQWAPNTYSVKFEKFGGDGTMADQAFTYGEEKPLATCTFTRTGYTFAGWSTASGGSNVAYTDGQSVSNLTDKNGATVTLYARWTAHHYTVRFNKNHDEATGTMADQDFTYGQTQALTANAFTRTGYTFVGWGTQADGTEINYINKESIKNLTATDGGVFDLYAQWIAVLTYIDADGTEQTPNEVTFITSNRTTYGDKASDEAWYAVSDEVTISDQLLFYDQSVHLILCDGASLSVTNSGGALNCSNGALTIYGQSQQSGIFNATSSGNYAIMSTNSDINNITINGGIVSATAYSDAIYANMGNVIINRGSVTATSTSSSGKSIYARRYDNVGGDVTINGGTVRTVKAIRADGSLTINGGIVNLNGLSYLYDDDSTQPDGYKNANHIAALNDGTAHNIKLYGRTLYKDGKWNTLCLPFDLDAGRVEAILNPEKLMTLSSTSFAGDKLTLNFEEATTIEAGKPYIIKWSKVDGYDQASVDSRDIKDPVFTVVTIKSGTIAMPTDYMNFIGTTSSVPLTGGNKSVLYLGSNNNLYYPASDRTIGAFRAYFQLGNGLTVGDPASPIKEFKMNFGNDDDADGIGSIHNSSQSSGAGGTQFIIHNDNEAIYNLAGQRLQKMQRGINIVNGKKVLK